MRLWPFSRRPSGREALEPAGRDVLTHHFDAIGGKRWEGSTNFGNVGTETLAAALPMQGRAALLRRRPSSALSAVNALVGGTRRAGHPCAPAAELGDLRRLDRVADADGRTDYGRCRTAGRARHDR